MHRSRSVHNLRTLPWHPGGVRGRVPPGNLSCLLSRSCLLWPLRLSLPRPRSLLSPCRRPWSFSRALSLFPPLPPSSRRLLPFLTKAFGLILRFPHLRSLGAAAHGRHRGAIRNSSRSNYMLLNHHDQFGFEGFEFFGKHTDKETEASHGLAHHHQQSKHCLTNYLFRTRRTKAERVIQASVCNPGVQIF